MENNMRACIVSHLCKTIAAYFICDVDSLQTAEQVLESLLTLPKLQQGTIRLGRKGVTKQNGSTKTFNSGGQEIYSEVRSRCRKTPKRIALEKTRLYTLDRPWYLPQ